MAQVWHGGKGPKVPGIAPCPFGSWRTDRPHHAPPHLYLNIPKGTFKCTRSLPLQEPGLGGAAAAGGVPQVHQAAAGHAHQGAERPEEGGVVHGHRIPALRRRRCALAPGMARNISVLLRIWAEHVQEDATRDA
eukprot:1300109-Prymnesium_polylepis.1